MSDPGAPSAPEGLLDRPEAGGRLIRGSVLRTGSYFAALALGLISAPLMTSHLGVVDFGRYVTATSLVLIANTLTEAGLGNLAVREYAARRGRDRLEFLSMIYGLKLVLVVMAVTGAVVFAVAAGYPAVLVAGVAIAGAGVVVTNVQGVYAVALAGDLRLGWTAAIDLLRQVVFVGAVVILVVSSAGLLPFFAVSIVAAAATLAVTLAVAFRALPILPRFDAGAWRALLRETLPYAIATAAGILYFRVAIIAMGFVSDERQTGLFSASFRLIEVLAGVPYLLATSAFPILARAARTDQERLRYAVQRLFEVSLLLGTGVAACLLTGASFAMDVVTGGSSQYDGADAVLRIQSVALVATFLIGVWSFALLSLSHYRTLLVANGAALVMVLVLTVFLASEEGARGTGLAMTITEFFLASALAVGLVRARPDLRMGLGVVPKVLCAAAVAIAIAMLSGLPAAPASLVTGAVYAVIVLALRAVPPELWRALARR